MRIKDIKKKFQTVWDSVTEHSKKIDDHAASIESLKTHVKTLESRIDFKKK